MNSTIIGMLTHSTLSIAKLIEKIVVIPVGSLILAAKQSKSNMSFIIITAQHIMT